MSILLCLPMALAFAPPTMMPLTAPAARAGLVTCSAASGRRAALFAGATAAASALAAPKAAVASAEDYMSKEDEDQQILVLTVISLIVLISPTVGIQMARKAISDIKDEDDDRFSGNSDPTWNSGAKAGRDKKLAAQLKAEQAKKKKGFFG